jgi:hypothetical protein
MPSLHVSFLIMWSLMRSITVLMFLIKDHRCITGKSVTNGKVEYARDM